MAQRIIHGIEELRALVGQEVAVSDWFTLDQSRINAFAEVSEDLAREEALVLAHSVIEPEVVASAA